MSGTIVEVNKALAEKPEGINQDAHGSWFVVLEPADAGEGQALLDAAQYAELTK